MRALKIAGIAVGALVAAWAAAATYGIPVRGLIESRSSDALAKAGLRLAIGGDARFTVWPATGLTIEQMRLQDAGGADELLAVERVHAALSLGELFGGRVHIADLALTRPVLRTDAILGRAQREAESRERGIAKGGGPAFPVILPTESPIAIDAVSVEDGRIFIREGRESIEVPLDALRITSAPSASGGRSNLQLDARVGPTRVRLKARVDRLTQLADGQAIPLNIAIDTFTPRKMSALLTATVTKSGPLLKIENLDGAIDQGKVRGSISVSFAEAKPFIDAALDSERIDLTGLIDTVVDARNSVGMPGSRGGAAASRPPAPGPRGNAGPAGDGQVWSDAPLNLFGLRLVEASVNLSAREVLVDNVRIAPAVVEATLLRDVLSVKLDSSGLYGGQASGELTVDRTKDDPSLGLQLRFSGIDALPFLRDAIDFPYIAGRAHGAVGLTGAGRSPLQIVSSLNGRADMVFENGAVRGLNLPNMVRSLLDMILAGWQANSSEETRFRTFSASFTVEKGVARSTDVRFTGPFLVMTAAGAADLRTRTLDFRADPRLVASAGTPGEAPRGIGVPVVIQGPWSDPRIYADTPNILANPETALRALRDALGGGRSKGSQTDAPLGKLIEGLSKGLGKSDGETSRDGGGIAEDMLKALGGARGGETPQSERTAPDPDAARPSSKPPPEQDLERRAREFLQDLLGR